MAYKFLIETFGCQMNKLDSELVADSLIAKGFEETRSLKDADIILVNTCSVRQHAEDRVYSRIGALKSLKKRKPGLVIGLIGCMAQKEKENIFSRIPHVSLVCGPSNLSEIAELVENLLSRPDQQRRVVAVSGSCEPIERNRNLCARRLFAYVSAMRGCDRFCSYCIVPYVRGQRVCREIEDLKREVESLVRAGAKEITLLGQDVNSYQTSKGEKLPDLLYALSPISGLLRLRFITSHPSSVDERLFEAMRDLDNVCEYLHLPAQSGSNRILAAMNRGYTREEYLHKTSLARGIVPDIEIASDFIVGFPGESEDDFSLSVSLAREAQFANSFVFKYSPRPGTRAAEMTDDVPQFEKARRNTILLSTQEEIRRELQKSIEGKRIQVLVEGVSKRDKTRLVGRTRSNRIVVFEGDKTLTGGLVAVEITASTALTLFGKLVSEAGQAKEQM
jgi:tRNA-2-methylthio-N6-dimethylallyladenosine synthase